MFRKGAYNTAEIKIIRVSLKARCITYLFRVAKTDKSTCVLCFFLFSTQSFYYPVLQTGEGKKYSVYHQPPSHFQIYSYLTILYMQFNIIKENIGPIEKMNPSECGRALTYIIDCEGKYGCSIIP